MPRSRRFLAPGGRSGDGHGYLNQPQRPLPQVADPSDTVDRIAEARALCDEPEAPSPDWVDAESELAAERNRIRLLRQAEMARQSRQFITEENRLLDVVRRSRVKRVDLSHDVHIARKFLARGKRDAARERIERMEAVLDGVLNQDVA